jgi:hypothetical protein
LKDRWTCVLLCAELRERGYLARCTQRLAVLLLLSDSQRGFSDPSWVGPVHAVLADRDALRAVDILTLTWLRAAFDLPAVALLDAADAGTFAGPWDRVLRRPLTLGAVADGLEELVRGRRATQRDVRVGGIDLRLDSPWPAARCLPCGSERHCESPRNAIERERVRTALAAFAVEHDGHGA